MCSYNAVNGIHSWSDPLFGILMYLALRTVLVDSVACWYPDRMCCVETSANTWLLRTIAREAWGFDGYVTADVRRCFQRFICDSFVRYLIAKEKKQDSIKP